MRDRTRGRGRARERERHRGPDRRRSKFGVAPRTTRRPILLGRSVRFFGRSRLTASATPTASFPFTSAITITAGDHDHVPDHASSAEADLAEPLVEVLAGRDVWR